MVSSHWVELSLRVQRSDTLRTSRSEGTLPRVTTADRANSGTATAKPWLDRIRIIDNLQTSLEVYQATYYQGAAVTLTVRGTVGAKYIVTSLIGGSYSQWAGAS